MNLISIQPITKTTKPTNSTITWANRWDHFLARWGVRRIYHRVDPGLYTLGNPNPKSPVFVTANYTLSFDALRSALKERDCYILVLDTKGINVWCAAGKGTFGTNELVNRIRATGLEDIVTHRTLILPQLGAPGVSAHEVKQLSGFKVEYGPVLASDLPEYLETRKATAEMRRVRFPLRDRLVLIPVDLVQVLLPTIIAAIILFFIGGSILSAAAVAAVLTGVVLFPILLPWIPIRDFSMQGLILGGVVALPFVTAFLFAATTLGNTTPDAAWWFGIGKALGLLLSIPPVTAYLSLNFTGSTTFTSRTSVEREISTYIPIMAWMFGIGFILTITLSLLQTLGGYYG